MNKIAERYASGLYQAAEELGRVETVAADLLDVSALVKLSGDSLTGHMISDAEKAALLRELLTGQVNALTLEVVVLMAARHAIDTLPATAEEFERLAGKSKVPVHLRVPYPLDESVLSEMKIRLVEEKVIPREAASRAEFEVVVDESLMGGFIAECEGTQLDASFKTALDKAKS
jgi:ATP synthase F1 delta subunit